MQSNGIISRAEVEADKLLNAPNTVENVIIRTNMLENHRDTLKLHADELATSFINKI